MTELKIKIDDQLMKKIKEHLSTKDIPIEKFIIHSIKNTLKSERIELGELLEQYPD